MYLGVKHKYGCDQIQSGLLFTALANFVTMATLHMLAQMMWLFVSTFPIFVAAWYGMQEQTSPQLGYMH